MALEGKRSTLKTSIVKISKFSKDITGQADIFELESLYERLGELWQKYEDVHMAIIERTGPRELEFEQIEFSDTENLVIQTNANFKRAIKERKSKELQDEESSQRLQSPNYSNEEGNAADFSGLRVPRVEVPKFSGDYLEWPSFRDLFSSLVGKNPKVPNVQKLSYLKKVVIEPAAKLIRNIKITSENFDSAWAILESRYENERIIVSELLNNIFMIPNATGSANDIKLILDTTLESLRELKNLKRPVEGYGDWLVFIVVKKLDQLSLEKWNEMIGDEREVVEWYKLEEFLNIRFRILEGSHAIESTPVQQSKLSVPTKSSKSSCHVSESTPKAVKCYYCKGGHRAKSCFTFKKKNPSERRKIVESANLCFNCLSPGHKLAECSSTRNCFKCGLQHHSLLHLDSPQRSEAIKKTEISPRALESTSSSSSSSLTNHLVEHNLATNKDVLLATAIIVVKFGSGKKIILRALLDQGSQMSLISTFPAKRLRLVSEPYLGVPLTAAGGDLVDTRRGVVNFNFHSKLNGSQFQTNALVIDTVSHYQQNHREVFHEACKLLRKSELADPDFDDSNQIDVLLAADVYAQVVLEGVRKFCGILVQNTSLGWILSGRYNQESCLMPSLSLHHISLPLDDLLRSFWEIEELPPGPNGLLSIDELACETYFQETHSRNSNGRYIVRLPFKVFGEKKELGYSRGLAISSQIRMENRFVKNPILKAKYHEFMEESIQMGHMELVPEKDLGKPTNECFYMPHHAVIRESSTTTSLRVVFNASQKSSTGLSLNDLLLTGPKLQSHLFDILIRFRKHSVCFMSDVEKMYRRILIHKKDRDYQRIVWREDPKQALRTYRMRVVTDGTSAAPFLAIRTIRQLAEDERVKCPLAYGALMDDLFMDDLVSGNTDVSSGIEQIRDINNIFKTAGMRMRKWTSNVDAVLKEIPPEDRQNVPIEFGQGDFVKVLGIQWFPSTDCFGFKVRLPPAEATTTKRKLLSHGSKLFDPLGFLSPCTIIPKIMFQKLWELKLKWDDPLPKDIKNRWIKFRDELPLLETTQIPRFIGSLDGNKIGTFELHGFSDAAQPAYSAVVYSRIQHPHGQIEVKMIAAKTKVAPVKKITIHCGELCGALLVSRLLKKVNVSLKVDNISMYGWTDSEIVLGWLRKSPGVWQQFVGNRTSAILDIIPFQQWEYVKSSQNPADCASRGILPSQLVDHTLWWNGPKWLSEDKSKWPSTVTPLQLSNTDFMQKKSVMNMVTVNSNMQFMQSFSSLRKLLRMTAWCLRFINNVRKQISDRSVACQSSAQPVQGLRIINQSLHHVGPRKCESRHQENTDQKSDSFLTTMELQSALKLWIKIVQEVSFAEEIRTIKSKKSIRRGMLRKLNPKFDLNEGILRLGGRLTNAHIPHDQKFPMVLPRDNYLTSLIIEDAHVRTLHGNVQLMLNYLRRRYWILGARQVVRHFVRKRCKICIKWSSVKQKQQMAALPRPRVTPSRCFSHTGVDFAGPIYIKDKGRGRHQSLSKGYVAVFICLSTKAIHLEAAEDLSTKEFIEAFKRFVSRRGIPQIMYSDNGSNFVGCTTELSKLQEAAMRKQMKEIAASLANDGVEWKFNPPTASHFGGIWEAAVKSMKYHLRRIVGSAHLTFKDLTTLLCQIECALNSRPICSLTDNFDDLNFLTPGHFLMGTSPSTLPEESLLNINENRLTKWQRSQQMFQNFWKLWSIEYLSNLQNRSKWFSEEDNLKIGELVILKEDDLPPTKWLMGRVIEVHAGSDGLVRAVTVRLKCKHNVLTIPITKLCRLPFLKSDELDVGL